jgi:hypothetical protein
MYDVSLQGVESVVYVNVGLYTPNLLLLTAAYIRYMYQC